ncbi:MAG TPA: hypothetical protein VGN13_12455 [Solirubrobacteraceae bacterium]|jgi:hypothetical protein
MDVTRSHDPWAPEDGEKKRVKVPEGVTPGETPGWPADAKTGEALDLTPDQREKLAAAKIDSSETKTATGKAASKAKPAKRSKSK